MAQRIALFVEEPLRRDMTRGVISIIITREMVPVTDPHIPIRTRVVEDRVESLGSVFHVHVQENNGKDIYSVFDLLSVAGREKKLDGSVKKYH